MLRIEFYLLGPKISTLSAMIKKTCFQAKQIPGGENSARRKFPRRKFRAAKIPGGEISRRRNFPAAKFPRGEISRGENSRGENSRGEITRGENSAHRKLGTSVILRGRIW